jgi:hypothetical protein
VDGTCFPAGIVAGEGSFQVVRAEADVGEDLVDVDSGVI